jgi:hypothetical protein
MKKSRRPPGVPKDATVINMPKDKTTMTFTSDGEDCFIEVDDLKIAKRARPDTPQAGTWISLEPGWTVHFDVGREHMTVTYDGDGVQVH